MMSKKTWFSVQNKGNKKINVSIFDDIGLWGVTAKEFIEQIQGDYEHIHVDINSYGGNVFDGFAMYNALVTHQAHITTRAMGIAASAASLVFMAGDDREIPEDAYLMVHQPFGGVYGVADDMRDYADLLDKIKESIINIYMKNTTIERDEIDEMVNSETWMNGKDSVAHGFATTLLDAANAAALAKSDVSRFKHIPDGLKVAGITADVSNIKTISDVESFLRDTGGFSRGLATALTSQAKTVFRSDSEREQAELLNALNSFKLRK